MMGIVRWFSVLLVLIVLSVAGCSSTGDKKEAGIEAAPADQGLSGEMVKEEGAGMGQATPLPEEGALTLDALNDPGSPLAKRIIYFDYDSDTVRPEFMEVIETHGRFLAQYPQQRVRLEGHTDERGSREYNLALGERRARTVLEMLQLQGAGANQIEVVTFGEELPAAFGHDDASWRLNRRVELVYPE